LVTGAARRLGRDLALALAAEGARVVIHYNTSANEAEDTAGQLRATGTQAWILQADLSDARQVEVLFPRAVEIAGPMDILVNNASVFPASRLETFSSEEIQETLQINALAPLALSRAFAAQRREGSILHLLDARMMDHDAGHAAYHLSKRMLFTLMRMMALEFAPLVRVNAVAPGLVLPPPGETEEYLKRLAHTNPLQTHGDSADVTEAALYLLRSRFVTGQVIFVDGGRHMKGNMYG
jgi:NAD(P)-dependent dehydrogenase (short-subunit alcohol dehydrogenase family)